MDSTVAVQTKRFGSSFQACRKSVMALCKSSTLKNDQIQPTGTGGHKVRDEARVSVEPRHRPGMPMSPVVIHHQVQGNVSRKLLVESAEKLKKLLVSMPLGYGARNSPKGILGPRLCYCIQCILGGPKNAIFASLRYSALQTCINERPCKTRKSQYFTKD
jgi:hypothetical protein